MDAATRAVERLTPEARAHVDNVAANLQLAADLGYGDVALLVPDDQGSLVVVADARPATAAAAVPSTRVGRVLPREEEPEAYDALASGSSACSTARRTRRGIAFTSTGYPVGADGRPYAVLVRHLGQSVAEAPGKMEVAFMRLAALLLERLCAGPLIDLDSDEPYATTRTAGDGVLEVAPDGTVAYASPNAVNIMRLAGAEGSPVGASASALPGGASAISPVLGSDAARSTTLEVNGRSLRYRTIGLERSALVLVDDVTEAHRREQELRVKEMAIREVHHRVKNNLQTIASLLRIQARRSASEEAANALEEAVERVSSMAVVHEMLAESAEESVDLAEAIGTIVRMVSRGLAVAEGRTAVTVEGLTGLVDAPVATALALVAAELVHNALEHGVGEREGGSVAVTMRRTAADLTLVVRDDGPGLPEGFAVESSANLGLAIVRTIVEDDLRGTLSFSAAGGTRVTVRVPMGGREE
jgi:two-component sensor histidine kinase